MSNPWGNPAGGSGADEKGLFQSVVESAPNAIVMTNKEGKIVLFNAQAEKLFGYRRDEIIGQSIEVLMPANVRQAHVRYRTGYNQNPQRRAMGAGRDLVGLRKDGTSVPVEIGLNPIQTPEGPHVLASIIDITERRHAEAERVALQKQVLEASERERRRIGQDLHDDLGQRLLGIGFLTKVLKEELAETNPEKAKEADRIVKLLNEALGKTRQLAKGLYAAELEANDLHTALRQLSTNLESVHSIDCNFSCEVPPSVYDRQVAANAYRIAQEALNNAVKHGEATRIEVALRDKEGLRELTIRDNGVGFSPESDHSSGMGLQVMRYRANLIGGNLTVERHPQGGTLVTCAIPVEDLRKEPS